MPRSTPQADAGTVPDTDILEDLDDDTFDTLVVKAVEHRAHLKNQVKARKRRREAAIRCGELVAESDILIPPGNHPSLRAHTAADAEPNAADDATARKIARTSTSSDATSQRAAALAAAAERRAAAQAADAARSAARSAAEDDRRARALQKLQNAPWRQSQPTLQETFQPTLQSTQQPTPQPTPQSTLSGAEARKRDAIAKYGWAIRSKASEAVRATCWTAVDTASLRLGEARRLAGLCEDDDEQEDHNVRRQRHAGLCEDDSLDGCDLSKWK